MKKKRLRNLIFIVIGVVVIGGIYWYYSNYRFNRLAQDILEKSGIETGLIVHLGCNNGRLTAALGANGRYVVHGVTPEEKKVKKARRYIQDQGLYGEVSVDNWDQQTLPYANNTVNLLVTKEVEMISKDEIMEIIQVAEQMQADRFGDEYTGVLKDRSFLMFFYNPSVRTRQSFEIAATELGGHGLYIEPGSMRLKTKDTAGETIEDVAGVMSRYGCGVGIRILEGKVDYYGRGDEVLREYDKYLDVPLVSFAHDRFHP